MSETVPVGGAGERTAVHASAPITSTEDMNLTHDGQVSSTLFHTFRLDYEFSAIHTSDIRLASYPIRYNIIIGTGIRTVEISLLGCVLVRAERRGRVRTLQAVR